ncbi:MAG TPA: S8 family serine peptidase, partial [Chitinophagaceae bacterium]
MLKKCCLFTVLGFLCFMTIAVQAQVQTNTAILSQASKAFRASENDNYAKALLLAKQKGWPLVITGRNNKIATLVGVDVFGFPKYYVAYNNTIAAATTKANQLWPGGSSGLNLSGSSANMKNKIGEWDAGSPLTTHVELVGRINYKDAANPGAVDHSTHVAGTMIATGVNPIAKGMAFEAQGLICYEYNGDISEMFGEANNLLLSNHSYGILAGWNFNSTQNRWEWYGKPGDAQDYKFGYYSVDAQSLDSIAYNAPNYLIVKAAGNNRNENGPAVGQTYWGYSSSSPNALVNLGARPATISSNNGYDIISWDANAKNILTIGAVNGIPAGYSSSGDVVMSSFSSWGPTDDGRIKPDLVADGVGVTSCVATSNTAYATFDGTSMATPNTTGSLFLLQEYYSQLKSGSFMRSATLKGLAIHTADEAGLAPGPDYQFGWGLLDVLQASKVLTAAVVSNNAATSNHLVYENTLNSGVPQTYNVVASGNGPLLATICWTDVKGTVETTNVLNNPTKKLVNDLDLRITKTSTGTVYMPWILDPANPGNAATRGDNSIDNVERVNVDTAQPGQAYTITITNKGALVRGSQAYSLIVSGVGGTAICTTSGASNSGGANISNVTLGSFTNTPTASCTAPKYNNYTNLVAAIQPSQSIPLSVKVGSCDVDNPKIATVYIDYNNNGVFTDPGEMVAQSGTLSNGGVFSTTIITPATLVPGNTSVMRVIVEETSTPSSVTPCGLYAKGETEDYLVKVGNASN